MTKRRIIYHALCWLIGALFIYAGANKLVNPILAAESVRNYDMLGDPWVTIMALLLPWVEILAGTLLLIQCWMPGALSVIAGCAVVFQVAIGSAWARGLDISCGCFSSAQDGPGMGSADYALHTLGLVGLLLACVWLWRVYVGRSDAEDVAAPPA